VGKGVVWCSLVFELSVVEHFAGTSVLLEHGADVVLVTRVLVGVEGEGSTAAGFANGFRIGAGADSNDGERIILAAQRYV